MTRENGDWRRLRDYPNLMEVDFHWSGFGPREVSYWDSMAEVYNTAINALKEAYEIGKSYVLTYYSPRTDIERSEIHLRGEKFTLVEPNSEFEYTKITEVSHG